MINIEFTLNTFNFFYKAIFQFFCEESQIDYNLLSKKKNRKIISIIQYLSPIPYLSWVEILFQFIWIFLPVLRIIYISLKNLIYIYSFLVKNWFGLMFQLISSNCYSDGAIITVALNILPEKYFNEFVILFSVLKLLFYIKFV